MAEEEKAKSSPKGDTLKIKAEQLKGKTVISPDGKAKWSKDGDEHEVSKIAGTELLKKAPRGMFKVTKGDDPMAGSYKAGDDAKKKAAEFATKREKEREKLQAAKAESRKKREEEEARKRKEWEEKRASASKTQNKGAQAPKNK